QLGLGCGGDPDWASAGRPARLAGRSKRLVGNDLARDRLLVDGARVGDVGRVRRDRRQVERRGGGCRGGGCRSGGCRSARRGGGGGTGGCASGTGGQGARRSNGHGNQAADNRTEGRYPQNNNLFRRPAGLADGLALKEPALPTVLREIRPNNLGPPFPDNWSRTRRSGRHASKVQ